MDTLIKLNTQTAGRDKIIRLIQYLSRFVWHRLQKISGADVDKLKSLEYTLSTFRKLLRWGRCVDTIYSVLPLMHHPDAVVRFTISMSKINSSLFLLADHILWLTRAGICRFDTEKWSKISHKYWLFAITMNLVRDFYEIMQILKSEKSVIWAGHKCIHDMIFVGSKALICLQSHKDVMIDTIKNLCDFFIPLTALGYTKLSPSMIGCLGVISSLAGLLALTDPQCKLSPV